MLTDFQKFVDKKYSVTTWKMEGEVKGCGIPRSLGIADAEWLGPSTSRSGVLNPGGQTSPWKAGVTQVYGAKVYNHIMRPGEGLWKIL